MPHAASFPAGDTQKHDRPSRWHANDLAAIRERPFRDGPELPWSNWAMRPAAIALLLDEMRRGRRAVVELGSGASTVIFARAARELGGRVVSVEHDPEWASGVRDLLSREGLGAVAEVVDAPLVPFEWPDDFDAGEFSPPRSWYDAGAVRAACPERIELLVVDGPPGAESPDALVRAPAVPELRDLLAEDWAMVLDDISRPAEQHAALQWRRMLSCELAQPSDTDLAVLSG